MRHIPNIPTNSKTLFLRNLEYKLLNYCFIKSDDLQEYRKYFAYEVMNLLDKYEFSLSDENHLGLINQFIGDSVSMREELDKKLFN